MTNIIQNKVHEIAELLFCHIVNKRIYTIKDSGLYSGTFGIILFLAHYLYFFPNNKYQSIYEQYVSFCLMKLTEENQNYTYCTGLSGILNCLELMNSLSLINIDYSDVEDNSYNKLLNIMKYNMTNANYDFMHGGLGIAFCYKNDKKMAIETVQALDKSAIRECGTVKWKSFLSSEKINGYNISLSHGMSSIIIYLAEIYKRNMEQEIVKELLKGVSKYVLSQEIDVKEYGSCFPPLSLTNGELTKSRLAWCYGDLGIAAALWQAGESLGDKTLCSKSIEVFKQCSYRRDIDKEIVMDAGICHGSAGIAMIFNYIYRKTGDIIFLDAYNYWLSITLRLGTLTEGLCGFKKYIADGTDERIIHLTNEYDLLEGLAGIGLVLLSSINQKLTRDWSELFLLY